MKDNVKNLTVSFRTVLSGPRRVRICARIRSNKTFPSSHTSNVRSFVRKINANITKGLYYLSVGEERHFKTIGTRKVEARFTSINENLRVISHFSIYVYECRYLMTAADEKYIRQREKNAKLS